MLLSFLPAVREQQGQAFLLLFLSMLEERKLLQVPTSNPSSDQLRWLQSHSVVRVRSACAWHSSPWVCSCSLGEESGSSSGAGVSHHFVVRDPQPSNAVHPGASLQASLRCSSSTFSKAVFKYCTEFKRREVTFCALVGWEQEIFFYWCHFIE